MLHREGGIWQKMSTKDELTERRDEGQLAEREMNQEREKELRVVSAFDIYIFSSAGVCS